MKYDEYVNSNENIKDLCAEIDQLRKEKNELKTKYDELNDFNNSQVKKLLEQNAELKSQIEKMKSEIEVVYLAFVYHNDCLVDVVSFRTLENAEKYKKSKDSYNHCCVVNVNIEQHYLR